MALNHFAGGTAHQLYCIGLEKFCDPLGIGRRWVGTSVEKQKQFFKVPNIFYILIIIRCKNFRSLRKVIIAILITQRISTGISNEGRHKFRVGGQTSCPYPVNTQINEWNSEKLNQRHSFPSLCFCESHALRLASGSLSNCALNSRVFPLSYHAPIKKCRRQSLQANRIFGIWFFHFLNDVKINISLNKLTCKLIDINRKATRLIWFTNSTAVDQFDIWHRVKCVHWKETERKH